MPRDAWRSLPPLQRTSHEHASVCRLDTFGATLSSHQDPRFVEPLGHDVRPEAPSGVVADLARPVPAPRTDFRAAPVQRTVQSPAPLAAAEPLVAPVPDLPPAAETVANPVPDLPPRPSPESAPSPSPEGHVEVQPDVEADVAPTLGLDQEPEPPTSVPLPPTPSRASEPSAPLQRSVAAATPAGIAPVRRLPVSSGPPEPPTIPTVRGALPEPVPRPVPAVQRSDAAPAPEAPRVPQTPKASIEPTRAPTEPGRSEPPAQLLGDRPNAVDAESPPDLPLPVPGAVLPPTPAPRMPVQRTPAPDMTAQRAPASSEPPVALPTAVLPAPKLLWPPTSTAAPAAVARPVPAPPLEVQRVADAPPVSTTSLPVHATPVERVVAELPSSVAGTTDPPWRLPPAVVPGPMPPSRAKSTIGDGPVAHPPAIQRSVATFTGNAPDAGPARGPASRQAPGSAATGGRPRDADVQRAATYEPAARPLAQAWPQPATLTSLPAARPTAQSPHETPHEARHEVTSGTVRAVPLQRMFAPAPPHPSGDLPVRTPRPLAPAGPEAAPAVSPTWEAPAPIVQRAGEDAEPAATEPAATEATSEAAPSAEPAAPTSAAAALGSTSPAPAKAGGQDLDELARRLYGPVSAMLRAELWLDRERSGRSFAR